MSAVAKDRLHPLSDQPIADIYAYLVARVKLKPSSTRSESGTYRVIRDVGGQTFTDPVRDASRQGSREDRFPRESLRAPFNEVRR